jgi:hypothetical protein
MSKGDRITVAAYNNLQSVVNSVMGPNANGYGQLLSSLPAAVNTPISSTQWNALRSDMAKAYGHQTGAAAVDNLAITNPNPPSLQIVGSSTTISDAILTQYSNFSTNINTNRTAAAATQLTPNVAITSTQRTANWGGATDVISHTVTVTFNGYTQGGGALTVSPANHATYFFNAGGYIQLSATFVPNVDPPTVGTKNEMWKTLLSQFNQIYFRSNATTALGGFNTNSATSTEGGTGPTADSTTPGVASTVGFNSLTVGSATYTQIFRTTGPSASKYIENDYIIKVRRPTTSTLEFVITFRDDDAGDQTGIGAPVDEEVVGTLTSVVRCTRPSGANVDVPAPTGVSTGL